MAHELTFIIAGKDAAEVEQAAQGVVQHYFGEEAKVKTQINVQAVQTSDGRVTAFEGMVTALRA